jgi:hypothetical protein
MAQVTRKGEKPVASPALEEALRRRRARTGPPTEHDAPPPSTFPGKKPHVHEGQERLA